MTWPKAWPTIRKKAQNIAHVLTQARSHGLACILAHQAMSQLNPPGGVDLRDLVMSCTNIKQFFAARDPWLQKYISDMSGKTKYYTLSYNQAVWDVNLGQIGYHKAIGYGFGDIPVQVQEYVGPRLTLQDIQEISSKDNLCIFAVEHGKGLSQYQGYFPMYVEWPFSKQEYQERESGIPWPPSSPATLTIPPDWPGPTGHTIVPTTQPPSPSSPERLRDIQRRLAEEGP